MLGATQFGIRLLSPGLKDIGMNDSQYMQDSNPVRIGKMILSHDKLGSVPAEELRTFYGLLRLINVTGW